MKAYFSKAESGKKSKFLYVKIQSEEREAEFFTTESKAGQRAILHDNTNPEIHLTVDSSFQVYCQKRLAIPHMVKIFSNRVELDEALARVGVLL